VGEGVLVKAQGPTETDDHLLRGLVVTALLEPEVVLGADPGEGRDLFPP